MVVVRVCVCVYVCVCVCVEGGDGSVPNYLHCYLYCGWCIHSYFHGKIDRVEADARVKYVRALLPPRNQANTQASTRGVAWRGAPCQCPVSLVTECAK